MPKRTLIAPTDEQLAAAEQTELRRRRDRIAELEDQQEQERLAQAGDPDAKAALNATASVLAGTPIGDDDEARHDAPPTNNRKTNPKTGGRKRSAKADKERRHQQSESDRHGAGATPRMDETSRANASGIANTEQAYRLMDLAYQKWAKAAMKDPRKANRELAIDLGRDTALYLRAGVIRLSDIQATIQHLLMVKGAKDDEPDDQYEDDLESLRKDIRGGK